MTDFEYIFQQVKKFHFTTWDDTELRKCVDMLPSLSRQELISLYRNRWLKEEKVLREAIFNTLFRDQIGKREQRIKELSIDDLILEFKDKRSGNVALIRKEMRERYKAGHDKQKIAAVFNASSESDQQWVKTQIRKEQDGDSFNNTQ